MNPKHPVARGKAPVARGPKVANRGPGGPKLNMPKANQVTRGHGRVRFPERFEGGQLKHVTGGKVAKQLRLEQQYRTSKHGDVARRLDLHNPATRKKHALGGHHYAGAHPLGPHVRKHHYYGLISPRYAHGSFAYHYWGHHFFAGMSWYPHWSPWVNWSWHYHCRPIWDPRPLWCRPMVYHSCPRWVVWQTPAWVSLSVVPSGTWVDVPEVVVAEQYDLQLLAVRFVDPGHPEEQLGPRYRVWFRNNADRPVTTPFNVMIFAGEGETLIEDLPQAGVRVTSIEAGAVQSVDIRLPAEVFAKDPDSGEPTAFSTLHVLVDSHREIADIAQSNNGTHIPRQDVLPVDPATFEAEPAETTAGAEITIAGEGYGPQPGQVLVQMAGLELEAEILGWYDLGIRVKLPELPLATDTEAELVIVRGDGAAANPLKITVKP